MLEDALALHRDNRLKEAAAAYDKVLAEEPRNAKALHLRGLIHHQEGNLEQAERMLSDACMIDADNAGYHHNLGLLLAQGGRYRDALQAFTRAAKLNPNMADAHVARARCRHRLGELEAAESDLKLALRADQNHAGARYELGMAKLYAGFVDEANSHLARAAELQPSDPGILLGFARALMLRNAHGLAQQVLQNLIDKQPRFTPAHALLVEVLLHQGKREQASKQVAELQNDKAHAERAEAWLAAGDLYLASQRNGEALQAYQQGLKLPGSHIYIVERLAYIAETAHSWESASMYWRDLAESDPRRQDWRTRQAICQVRQGAAADALDTLAKIQPRSEAEAANVLATQAEIEQTRGDMDAALTHAREALAKDSEIVSARLLVIADKLRHEDYDAAVEALQKLQGRVDSLSIVNRARVRRLLALALDRQGDYEAALQVLAPTTTSPSEAAGNEQTASRSRLQERLKQQKAPGQTSSEEPPPGSDVVFLTGTPGSGVDSVALALAGHGDIVLLNDRSQNSERRDFLVRFFDADPAAILDEQLPRLRRRYYEGRERLLADAGHARSNAVVIDRLPMEFSNPALIQRVLPGAKVIHVQRDRADTVLKALFNQPLVLTPGDYDQLVGLVHELHDPEINPCASIVSTWHFDELLDSREATLKTWLAELNLDVSAGVTERATALEHNEYGLAANLPSGHGKAHYQALWKQA